MKTIRKHRNHNLNLSPTQDAPPRPVARSRQNEVIATRAFTFLTALGTHPELRRALASGGYTDQEHALGWKLVLAVTEAPVAMTPALPPNPAVLAIERISAWANPTLRRVRAGLARLHPEQETFLFDGIELSPGPGAVLATATFLARCDALASGERKETRKADRAALEVIALRGAPPDVRHEMAQLVKLVRTTTQEPREEAPSNASTPERDAQLRALRAWHSDWSETARNLGLSRRGLIQLGLAKRKRTAAPPVMPVVPAAPAPAAPNPNAGGA